MNGSWHLWVLWNADYPSAGGTAWRHYTSTDLVSWADRGVSIPKYTTVQGDAWTGSTVIDATNSAGFGAGAVIALLTQPCDGPTGQNQSTCLWYSQDGGKTFAFSRVVMPNSPGNNSVFRDPSVLWHESTRSWVMTLAERGKIGIYRSTDLLHWSYASGFFESNIGTMECPNLFPLHLFDSNGAVTGDKWVMLCAADGSSSGFTKGTYYWTGSFDGTTFVRDSAAGRWLDQGADFYATTVFADPNQVDPLTGVYALAWMSNWDYATRLQTSGYSGQLSVTRKLRLQIVNGVTILLNSPVSALDSVFTSRYQGTDQAISDSVPYAFPTWSNVPTFRLDFTLGPVGGIWPGSSQLSLRGGSGYFVQVGFDTTVGKVYVRRSTGGPPPTGDTIWNRDYDAPFNFTAPVKVSVLVDTNSVELFINDGEISISTLVTSPTDATALKLTSIGGASVSGLIIRSL